ncbi:PCNA-associated factor isoform X3 [Chelonia mydas]|uniref:PCNA-associated factor isoform X3 n=1 Tax=Chelonia mydas TaxID=8469 RepID=UPI001CA9A067|nr:PCNA-associated factor isoform X3 [Chelonia mydas]
MWPSGQKVCPPRDWLITPRAAPASVGWGSGARAGPRPRRVPAHACRREPLSGRFWFRSGPIGARRRARAGKAVWCLRSVRTRALSRSVRRRQRAGRAPPPLGMWSPPGLPGKRWAPAAPTRALRRLPRKLKASMLVEIQYV